MKNRKFLISVRTVSSLVLIAVMVLSFMGCNNNSSGQTVTTSAPTTVAQDKEGPTVKELGEGQTQFSFNVIDEDGKITKFLINTDEETVGAALLKVKLIEGDQSEYGFYVKTVNGITKDYDKDKAYWSFYVDGEYAMSGVDTTKIENGVVYSFKVEKA